MNNRETKFRYWSNIQKKFKNPSAIALVNGVCIGFSQERLLGRIPENVIIEQFTGIEDINGVDIYEGDLVSLHYALQPDNLPQAAGVYEVIWHRAAFHLKQHKHNWFSTSFGDPKINANLRNDEPSHIVIDKLPLGEFNICKVIGNLHENSDLIK